MTASPEPVTIGEFAGVLRAMADLADRLATRHDVAQMAELQDAVHQAEATAVRDGDLIAELRRQAEAMGRSLDTIGRSRSRVSSPGGTQVLVDALLVIGIDCSNYTGGHTCVEDGGRARGANALADAWCSGCVARDALTRTGVLTPGPPA